MQLKKTKIERQTINYSNNMRLFGIFLKIYDKYIYNVLFFSHNDFKQKRTHNATSMNAICSEYENTGAREPKLP